MPHVALVPFTGFRVREAEMLALGMSLPGLAQRGKALGELPALGLVTLAGLNPPEWSASYHPTAVAGESLLDQVLAAKPDLVALSALTASVEEAYAFAQQLKRAGVLTVIGGLHVTACAEEAAEYCDAVVVGEGERCWLQVLRDAERKDLQRVYYARDYPISNSVAWPQPRFDLLGPNPPRFTLQTQRGCPLACEFCAASRLLSAFQEKPLDCLSRELAAIEKLSPRPLLELADDNTFAGERDFGPLFDRLQASGARWFTESDWRLGERPELLKRLAGAGCVQVLVGIESLVFRYPGQGQKWNELDRIMRALIAIQEAGVVVNGCFITGAEGETRASLDRLTEFILASPLAEVQITLQTPFPGTRLHERLKQQGRLLPDRGWSHYTLFDVTYQPEHLSVRELEQGFRDVLAAVYSSEASARRSTSQENLPTPKATPLMSLRTLGLYLIGNREAILQIAATKHALWLGLLFVLSAGFAREYDGEDLLHEPGHLLIPLGASLATCTLLFALLWVVIHGWRTFSNIGRNFTEFLTLYWMTAPLAWIYAIPVERFLDARDAMVVNLCLLGLVSIWRVLLIIRVISVLLNTSMLRAVWPVILFADSLLIVIIASTPGLLAIMGGVRTDTSEGVLRATATFVGLAGFQIWWIWALATILVFFVSFDRNAPAQINSQLEHKSATIGAWRLAGLALLIWTFVLPFTQPQQMRRYYAERLAGEGNYNELISFLSKYSASSFPPNWDPPPYGESDSRGYELLAVFAALDGLPAEASAPWVRAAYEPKFADEFMNYYAYWEAMSPAEQQRTRNLMRQMGIGNSPDDHEKLKSRLHDYRQSHNRFVPGGDLPDIIQKMNQSYQ